MINIDKLSLRELEAIVKTQDWLLALLTDPKLETKRKDAINWHETEYLRKHYTDEGHLNFWDTRICSARQMHDKHPWPNAEYIKYERDGSYSMVRINGEYWIDIWVATSKCLDEYHNKYGLDDYCFLEGLDGCYDGVVHMSTGS